MSEDRQWDEEVESYLVALGRGDRRAALQQVAALSRHGHDVLTVIQRLLVPAQLRVGELWVSDVWSVAQEHAATAVTEAVIGSLALARDRQARPPAEASHLIVSCVEQEWHALPALMVSEHLRAAGFAVHYLGANASAPGLVRHVHEVGPAAVLLSCSLPTFLPLVRRHVEAIRETGTPVVVGGSAFDPLGHRARVLGATAHAGSAEAAVAVVAGLPGAVPPAPRLTHPGAAEAFALFADRETLAEEVEGHLLRVVAVGAVEPPEPDWQLVLRDQLPHLVGSVAGALVSDAPEIVADALGWASEVLDARGAPAGSGGALAGALRSALDRFPAAAVVLDRAGVPRSA